MAVSNTVVYTSENSHLFGKIDRAATRSVEESILRMERISRALAPAKTGKLRQSIKAVMLDSQKGQVVAGTDYAEHQEYGTAAHPITGHMYFWWAKRGKFFVWNDPRYDNWNFDEGATIQHPGHPAANGNHGFLRPAFDQVSKEVPYYAKRNFPG